MKDQKVEVYFYWGLAAAGLLFIPGVRTFMSNLIGVALVIGIFVAMIWFVVSVLRFIFGAHVTVCKCCRDVKILK